jgi:hypothetical protein
LLISENALLLLEFKNNYMRKMVWVGKEGSKRTYDTHAFLEKLGFLTIDSIRKNYTQLNQQEIFGKVLRIYICG